jgi:hypothetical protein
MSRKHSTALGIGAAVGGAAVATFLTMGAANAAPTDDGFQILFGAPSNTALQAGQGATDATDDANLTASNPGAETALTNDAVLFQDTGSDHAIAQLIYALDPSSFVTQSTPGVTGDLLGANAGDYLVPDNSLGFLATDLDFFLLNPTGLDPALLGPIIDTLLGFPTGGF